MKTRLLFASAMALFLASCAQTELEQLSQTPTTNVEGKGIKFIASVDGGANTRANLSPTTNNRFNVNWYADKDKIGVFYKEGTPIDVYSGQAKQGINGNQWNGLQENTTEAHPFTFKASASGIVGYFVAADDDNTLWLDGAWTDGGEPAFRAFWPLVDADYASSAEVDLPALATQDQTSIDGLGIVDKSFMISESIFDGEYDKNDNSVSKDRFSLNFTRVNPIMHFKVLTGSATVDDAKYNEAYPIGFAARYGKLQEVSLKAEGNADKSLGASKLTYNADAKWDMAATNLAEGFVPGTSGAASTLTTQLASGNGFDWSNDAEAFMVIANVNREVGGFAEDKPETMTANYKFEFVQLEKSITTFKNWEGNAWYGFPTTSGYDLDGENYNVYKIGSDFVLEINNDFTLADAFDNNGNVKGVLQNDGSAINKSDIKHFVSKVDLTDAADFSLIQSLTNLTHITLLENTTIPAKAFEVLGNVTYFNLPKVTTVDNVDAFAASATYKEVYMGSYDFSNVEGTNQLAVRNAVLKAANLEKADVSGVTTIGTLFIQAQYPSFDGFEKLTEITVKPGAEIATAGFKGCIALEKIEGSITLNESSNSQFAGSKVLTTIKISNTKIPEAAFSGCTNLVSVLDASGQPIAPTSIGESAFAGTALVNMDLSNATIIGKSAFENCASLVGVNETNAGANILYANAVLHVSDYAFKGCTSLKNISFAVATSIGVDILAGVTPDKIEFKKAFTVNSTVPTGTTTEFFGTTAGTALYCNKSQIGVAFPVANKPSITLTGNAESSTDVKTEFNIIDKKYE